MADVGARRRRQLFRVAGIVTAVVVVLVLVVVLVSGGGSGTGRPAASAGPSSSTRPSAASSTTTSTPGLTTTAPAAPATAVPKSSNPVVALAQQYDGVYSGRFQNRTVNSDGTAQLTLRVDPETSKMTVEVAFVGDLFGSGGAAPRTITATIDLGNPANAITTQTQAFGPVTGKLEGTSVVLDAPAVPGGGATTFRLRGSLVSRGFDSTYTAGFADGHNTQGTVAVRCAPTGQRPSAVTTVCSLPG